nr:Uncharacterised protein [Streptococcus thermophilus]
MTNFSLIPARSLTVSGARRAWIIILAVISAMALLVSTVTVPRAATQQAVQPDYPNNSRNWDPSIPFAAGAALQPNPAAESKGCGENAGKKIALVFDLSTSIGQTGLDGSKEAGRAIVNALDSTPTQFGIYNFGTVAPAKSSQKAQIGIQPRGSKDKLNSIIDQLTLPARGIVGTYWDRGIRMAAQRHRR